MSGGGFRYGRNYDLPVKDVRTVLSLEGVSHCYEQSGEKTLSDVWLNINSGERVALVGPNGAGKTTLFKLILGLEKLGSGRIRLFGHPAAKCLNRVAVIPQSSAVDWLFPVSVRQVVMMGRYVRLGWFRRPGAADREAVESAMKSMGIHDLADRRVGELSGGERQKVMLARTLAHDGDLLLFDEPLNHVDLRTQETIFHTLETLSARGKTVIVSTHDLGVLVVHFTRALFLDKKIIADGPPKEILTPQTIARAYGFEFHKDYKSWDRSSNS